MNILEPVCSWIKHPLKNEGTVPVNQGQAEGSVPQPRWTHSVDLCATLTETNPSYLMRMSEEIEMAGADAAFLKSLGCDATRKNVFDASAGMLAAG